MEIEPNVDYKAQVMEQMISSGLGAHTKLSPELSACIHNLIQDYYTKEENTDKGLSEENINDCLRYICAGIKESKRERLTTADFDE